MAASADKQQLLPTDSKSASTANKPKPGWRSPCSCSCLVLTGCLLSIIALLVYLWLLHLEDSSRSAAGPFVEDRSIMPSLTGTVEAAYDGFGGNPRNDVPCGTPIKFYFDKILHNNFGGVGPDEGDPVMRLSITEHDPPAWCQGNAEACNQHMILEVKPTTPYDGTRHNHNGLNGTMATIGVDAGKSVGLEFVLIDPSTGKHVVPKSFPITFFDIDSDPDQVGQEYVIPHGKYTPFMQEDALVDFEVSPGVKGDSVMYIAHPGAGLAKNPNNPHDLTKEQLQRIVAFEYQEPEKVHITVGSMAGPGIRLFSFSMFSVLKPCPWKLPRPPKDWRFYGLLGVLLLACCFLAFCITEKFCNTWRYRYRVMDMPLPDGDAERKTYAKDALKSAFNSRDPWRYRCALELALDAGVPATDIPVVLQLTKNLDSFGQLTKTGAPGTIDVQLCFVLDYTGSMGTQIKEVMKCLKNIANEVATFKAPNRPHAKVSLALSAIAYNDFDEKSQALGVPVVSVFGGKQMKMNHSFNLKPTDFNLGGSFTKSPEALQQFVDQPLGHGGNVPEEMTGALIAASNLPWTAEHRVCIVITDAPCHGHDYHAVEEDSFVDKTTGLTCSGRPEVPLKMLGDKKVEVSVLHTGSGMDKMVAKFRKTLPTLKDGKVQPNETGAYIVRQLKEALVVQPLRYELRTYDLEDPDAGMVPTTGERVQIRSDLDTKQYTAGRDGLIWLGYSTKEFKGKTQAVVLRQDDAALDSTWELASVPVDVCTEFEEGHKTMFVVPTQKV